MSTPEPGIWDLDCFRGADFEFTFSMTDPNGDNIVFTGCSAWLTAYDDQEKTVPILSLKTSDNSITIEDGENVGETDIKLVAKYSASDTAALPVDGHIYDLDVEFTDGTRWRIFTGKFTVYTGNLAT